VLAPAARLAAEQVVPVVVVPVVAAAAELAGPRAVPADPAAARKQHI
jgi:hypothetical protein